ncbi:MAG: transposase, partial [Chloroflexi bacterium]|nr:transposase [Chloroflexota bacterium]
MTQGEKVCDKLNAMKLTVTVSVAPDQPKALLNMMQTFNKACNYLSVIAFSEKTFGWLSLQRRAYHELRASFGLTAAQTVVAIRKVAYAYRNKARRERQASFKPLGAVPLYKHQYKRDGTVLIYGLRVPFKVREGITLSSRHQAHLTHYNGRFIIHQVVDVEQPPVTPTEEFLGCDLGIVNILTDSDGVAYSGAKINGL